MTGELALWTCLNKRKHKAGEQCLLVKHLSYMDAIQRDLQKCKNFKSKQEDKYNLKKQNETKMKQLRSTVFWFHAFEKRKVWNSFFKMLTTNFIMKQLQSVYSIEAGSNSTVWFWFGSTSWLAHADLRDPLVFWTTSIWLLRI